MGAYTAYTREQRQVMYHRCLAQFEQLAPHVTYNLTRGIPSQDMLDLSLPLLDVLNSTSDYLSPGLPGEPPIDSRNYGTLAGLPPARQFMADILAVPMASVMVGGNASLSLMHGVLSLAYAKGLVHSDTPWSQLPQVKLLAPVPGYDRHFAMGEWYGASLIPVAMTPTGPDMDQVESLVQDPAVRGMFCVPKYSNPTGVTYSPETVRRLAWLTPAAPDFCLWYDNAYELHDFAVGDQLLPIYPELVAAGRTNQVVQFTSLSKVTFAGGGMSALSTGAEQLQHVLDYYATQIISFDKLNQLRHVRFLPNRTHLTQHMKQVMALVYPKFQLCEQLFRHHLTPTGTQWSCPRGGYFISVNTLPGLATRVYSLATQAGLVLLPPGNAFPKGHDPANSHIRIAPTALPLAELAQAMERFALCVKLATLEQLLDR